MKKTLLFLCLLAGFQIHAQTIGTISTIPANPTTADSVYVTVDCHFTSGGCSPHTQGQSFLTSTTISAWALHCLGPLAVLCTYTDTFPVGMLPAGNYTFNFQLDEGFGGPPCTPGIVPGPTDSYNFTVSLPTSIQETGKESFNVYPNPATAELRIENAGLRIEKIEIYNVFGDRVFVSQISPDASGPKSQMSIDISQLKSGIYFVQIKTDEKLFRKMFSVQR